MTTAVQSPTTKRAPKDSMSKSGLRIAQLRSARGRGRIKTAAVSLRFPAGVLVRAPGRS